jgi:CheY-like chemotaxis protein
MEDSMATNPRHLARYADLTMIAARISMGERRPARSFPSAATPRPAVAGDFSRDEFLALVAHELRNPLAPIVTAAEILRRGSLDDGKVRKVGDLIQRQAAHMTGLLADLLDVSRVHKGLLALSLTVVDLRKVLADAVEQTRPLMDLRSQQFGFHPPAGPVLVEADEGRLVQVFANILNNAAKYTPARGSIRLAVEAGPAWAVVVVQDSGEGMSAALLPHVFDAFTQAKRSSDRRLGGLGLGLALVRQLVELHGGQVRADSEGLGKGSRLTVRLPLARATAPTDRRRAGPRSPCAQPLNVVVVEDDVDGALMLSVLLEMEGHAVRIFHAAEDALPELARAAADVYLLDIGLPGMDGLQLALVIALSGFGSAQDRERALAAGFDHHFEKPLPLSRLLDLIRKVPRPLLAAE